MPSVAPRVAPAIALPPDAVVDPRIGSSGPCLLALEDGTVFRGVAFGATGTGGGDLVVNTSQTGYQEVCTDPSYAGQVVVMTFPLIGNHGRFADDDQSDRPWLHGLVVGHATAGVLGKARQIVHLLRSAGVPAMAGLDTRALARHLRQSGSLRGVITAPGETDPEAAVAAARAVPVWEEQDFVSRVSAAAPYEVGDRGPVVAVIDLGLKTSIVRSLRRRGARVRVYPHTVGVERVLEPDVDGVVISPGPGDPGLLDTQVALARAVIDDGRPLLGICLGHQIVARAAGAQTRRLPFGHHAANHPVRDEVSGVVTVTAQNHEVAVVADSLPAESGFFVSQRNLNDGTVEGLRHHAKPIETVQYHPEGSPGPLDAAEVFDRFLGHVRAHTPAARS